MASTDVQICNMALGHLGHSGPFLTDLETDQSQEAEICNQFWETARDVALADYPWPFATARKELDELADVTRAGWAHAFALPVDCIQPREIRPVGDNRRVVRAEDRFPFDLEKADGSDDQILLCDVVDPVLKYTARVETVTKYPSKFALACSYKVAELIAIPLTGSKSKRDEMRQAYAIEITQSESQAMNGRQEDQPPETSSLAARR